MNFYIQIWFYYILDLCVIVLFVLVCLKVSEKVINSWKLVYVQKESHIIYIYNDIIYNDNIHTCILCIYT